jgi:hypothetical protein
MEVRNTRTFEMKLRQYQNTFVVGLFSLFTLSNAEMETQKLHEAGKEL